MTVRAPRRATIRPAQVEEAAALSALALRSKGYWGYDEAFVADYRDALTITPVDVAAHTVRVATIAGHPRGFYQVRGAGEVATLTDLWVEPDEIGRGLGRALWEHAVATARERGFRELRVQSDPHAEGFYRAMGAEPIGTQPSTVIPGLELPLLRLVLE